MPNIAATVTAEAPAYALDGSHGYHLTVTANRQASGWIYLGEDDRTVYATIDRAPWRSVGAVDPSAPLTPDWVAAHSAAILQRF